MQIDTKERSKFFGLWQASFQTDLVKNLVVYAAAAAGAPGLPPFSGSQCHSAGKNARPIHNLAIKAARTWIHGLSELTGVLWVSEFVFAILATNSIVIIPSRSGRLLFPGISALVNSITSGLAAESIFVPVVECARALGIVLKQPPGSGLTEGKPGCLSWSNSRLGPGAVCFA